MAPTEYFTPTPIKRDGVLSLHRLNLEYFGTWFDQQIVVEVMSKFRSVGFCLCPFGVLL